MTRLSYTHPQTKWSNQNGAENFGYKIRFGLATEEMEKTSKTYACAIGKKLGAEITTLSEIETNKPLHSLETLSRRHKKFDVNIFWLMFKKGTMTQNGEEEP